MLSTAETARAFTRLIWDTSEHFHRKGFRASDFAAWVCQVCIWWACSKSLDTSNQPPVFHFGRQSSIRHEMQHKDSFANWNCLKRIAAMWQSLQNYVKGLTLAPMLRVNVAERALNDRSFKRSWSQSRNLWASSPSSRHLAWVEVRSAVYAGNGLTLPRQALEHGIRHGTTPRTDSLLTWSLLRLAMDNSWSCSLSTDWNGGGWKRLML